MNMKIKQLAFYLRTYVLQSTVCKLEFLIFSSHNLTFWYLVTFAFDFLNIQNFAAPRFSSGGFLKVSVLGKLFGISWILLIRCLEMEVGKFAITSCIPLLKMLYIITNATEYI